MRSWRIKIAAKFGCRQGGVALNIVAAIKLALLALAAKARAPEARELVEIWLPGYAKG
jgi:hypothetical protein